MDAPLDEVRLGMHIADDPNRKTCMQTHEGNERWCLNDNKTVNNVALGSVVTSAARIK